MNKWIRILHKRKHCDVKEDQQNLTRTLTHIVLTLNSFHPLTMVWSFFSLKNLLFTHYTDVHQQFEHTHIQEKEKMDVLKFLSPSFPFLFMLRQRSSNTYIYLLPELRGWERAMYKLATTSVQWEKKHSRPMIWYWHFFLCQHPIHSIVRHNHIDIM